MVVTVSSGTFSCSFSHFYLRQRRIFYNGKEDKGEQHVGCVPSFLLCQGLLLTEGYQSKPEINTISRTLNFIICMF